MRGRILVKNSATANKSPQLSDLLPGELSVNRNPASPALYIRAGVGASNAADKIIRFGPVHISTTAPTPAATGETPGSLWFRPDTQQLRVYVDSSAQWVRTKSRVVVVSTTAPSDAEDGDLWFDTNNAALKVYLSTFQVWVEINSGAVLATYFGVTSPDHATSSVTFLGFSQAAANGEYIGVGNFDDLKGLTGTNQNKPPAGYGDPTVGSVTWQEDSIYLKSGTGRYLWKQNGYWYLADATVNASGNTWYRSQQAVDGGPETVTAWVAVTTNETNPPATGVSAGTITVQKKDGIIPSLGEIWFKSSIGAVMVWDGSTWLKTGCTQAEFNQLKERVEALEAAA